MNRIKSNLLMKRVRKVLSKSVSWPAKVELYDGRLTVSVVNTKICLEFDLSEYFHRRISYIVKEICALCQWGVKVA